MAGPEELEFPVYVDLGDGSEPFLFRAEDSAILLLDEDIEEAPLAPSAPSEPPRDPRLSVLETLLVQVQERRRARG